MRNTQLRLKSRMGALLLLTSWSMIAGCGTAQADTVQANADKPLKWESLNNPRVVETILENKSLSDTEKVAALAYELDKCITLAPLTPPDILNTTDYEKKKMQPINDYDWLIDSMAWDRKGKVRPQAVASVLDNFNTMAGIRNKSAVQSLLYVALNLAAGDAPESELLDLLDDPDTPSQIRFRILSGMLRSKRPRVSPNIYTDNLPTLFWTPGPPRVPLRALPILLELVDDPWDTTFYTADSLVRVYPVRELAYACLLELDVKAEKISVPDTEFDERGKLKLPKTLIRVDKASARKKLRELK